MRTGLCNNKDPPIGAAATTYLILGGNHDTVLDSGEIQVTLKDALSLINASEKQQQDGRQRASGGQVDLVGRPTMVGPPGQGVNPAIRFGMVT